VHVLALLEAKDDDVVVVLGLVREQFVALGFQLLSRHVPRQRHHPKV